MAKPLGRRAPQDDAHIRAHRLKSAASPLISVEHVLQLPWWHWSHDQGDEGACVGHGTAMERAIRERYENKYLRKLAAYTVRVNPWWIWDQAKLIDGFADTNPGDSEGTTVRAGYDVVRDHGVPTQIQSTEGNYLGAAATARLMPNPRYKATANEWATSVDQMRLCIARNQPVVIGVNWYSNFDSPVQIANGEHFIGLDAHNLGSVRGGHCVCIYGASDRRQAFRVKNSWGRGYPLVWLRYDSMQRLLNEDGEATVVVDAD